MEIQRLTEDIWRELPGREISDESLSPAEQLTYEGNGTPYVCVMVSKDGSLHLLISSDQRQTEKLINPGVIGLDVGLLPDWLVVGRTRQTYIDLRCDSHQFVQPFTVIVRQIALATLRDGKAPSIAVNSVIRLWRRFWIRQPSVALSESEQLGLIAELSTLQALIQMGVTNAVLAWTGPLGGEHDFEFTTAALEVKCALGNRRKHQINGLNQLQISEDRGLLLISFLALRGEGGVTLSDKVAVLSELLASPDEQEAYLDRLASSGYTPAHDEEYANVRFIIGQAIAFAVEEGFPRITPELLIKPVSPRIDAVRYTVDLEGLYGFELESEQFAAMVGLQGVNDSSNLG